MLQSIQDDMAELATSIIQALPTPVLLLDPANTVVFANSASEQYFQTSLRLLTGMSATAVIPPTSPIFGLIEKVRADQSSASEYEVLIGTPRSGGERAVDVQASSVIERPGHVLLLIQPRSAAQTFDNQLTYRGAARTVSGLATMLAHEIRNPLSGIRGAAQLIAPTLGDDDRALAQLICDETDRIRGLVDQLEVFSDDRPIEREPINIHSVLDHVKFLAANSYAGGIVIKEQYDPSLPPVFGNRDQLIQVFLNLVKNATEAVCETKSKGPISLSTAFRPGLKLTAQGSHERLSLPLEVRVMNPGPAIPPERLTRVFEPFYTTKASGKGLGLALVAKIIRDHGGVVECQSNDERTTFRILLPMQAAGQPFAHPADTDRP